MPRRKVPSVPTPLAGAVYVLTPDRVHPLDIPFTQAVKSVSRWGSGSRDLVMAMTTRALLVEARRTARVTALRLCIGVLEALRAAGTFTAHVFVASLFDGSPADGTRYCWRKCGRD